MLEVKIEDFIQMRGALAELRDEVAQHIQVYESAALPGSPAELELAGAVRPESLHTIRGQSFLLVEVVADQLTAFVKTVTEPIETIAPWTCVRSLVEAAALACWLLDPQMDRRGRLSRSLAFRFEGIQQQVKWARAAGQDAALAASRLSDVAEVARGLGYASILGSDGKVRGAGEVMPSVTELIKRMLSEEPLYRLLSAVAHGHTWALQQLSFGQSGDLSTTTTPQNVKLIPFEKTTSANSMAYLVLAAAKSFSRVAWYQSLYFGWNSERLVKILDAKFDRLNAAEHLRFWRSASG